MVDTQRLASRLRSARLSAGVSQEQAANELGLPRPAISLIESGNRNVSAIEITKLARLYGVGLAALLADESAEAVLTQLRSSAPVDSDIHADLEVQMAQFRAYAMLEEDVYGQQFYEVPSYPLPGGLIVSQGEWLAVQERRRLDLGHRPVGSMVVLVESQGVKLLMPNLSSREALSGAFVFSPSIGPCMIVNSAEAPARRRFTLAHEYAHFLHLNGESNGEICIPSLHRDPGEVRANAFAASFLLPAPGVAAFLGDFRTPGSPIAPEHLVHLAYHFGASYEAVAYRLLAMRYVTAEEKARLIESNLSSVAKALGYDQLPGFGEPMPSRFREIAIQAWRKEAISAAKLEELLGLKPGQARRTLTLPSTHARRLKRASAAEPDWL